MSNVQCVRTIRIAERPNLIWVEIETDEGLIGLGKSFRGTQAVEAVIHEQIAPWLVGRDSRQIEAVSRHLMTPYLGFHSSSAEVRAASAIDLALWDLAGKRHGIPVHEALGGAARTEDPCLQHLRRLRLQHEKHLRFRQRPPEHRRPATGLPALMMIRSPSCAMPARLPTAFCPRASRP